MDSSQYELSGTAFDSPAESAKFAPLYENTCQSLDFGGNRPFESTAGEYLPPIAIGDSCTANSTLVQSERVDDALNALFSPAYASQRSTIDGYDDPGKVWDKRDGQITQKSVQQWLDEAAAYPETRTLASKAGPITIATDKDTRYPEDLVQSLNQLNELWNSDASNALKNEDGNFTADSFTAGKPVLEAKIENLSQEFSLSWNLDNLLSKNDAAASDFFAVPNDLYKAVSDASTVQKGEGPYQSAQRLLALDGMPVDHADALTLAHALAEQYTCDQQLQGASGDLNGLQQNTQLLSAENAWGVLSRIEDAGLRQRLEAILGVGA